MYRKVLSWKATLALCRHTTSPYNRARQATYPVVSARALSKLSGELRSSFGFTPTASVVAALLTESLAHSEIAERLGISYNTVHTHTKAIHRKAAVPTTGRLTALIRATESKSS
jgi:DNA-binding CsgD family transcriptional regulator